MNDLHTLVPIAMGMVLSPLPIVAVVAILLAPRGRSSAPVYTATFTLVSLVVIGIGALGAAGAQSASGPDSRIVSLVIGALLTIGFAVFAIISWHGRPRNGEPAVAPKWLAAIDGVTPASAAGLGFVMAAANSKNIPLALKAGSVIGEAHLAPLLAAALCLAVAVAGSLLLIIPALVELTGSARVHTALVGLKSQLVEHNAAIMTALFAILAANEAAQLIHHLIG
ncbi:MAG: GAP family protein [Microbacterium sp.]|uniref:GAP family protein n=1 Tax=Microbacterium sp. TaxID=51671 RepID=UPI001AD30AE7|nr:GAP family protein [Microbacterium sp.]MBN9177794.1 GAP family protein [Microbacterium sp.]